MQFILRELLIICITSTPICFLSMGFWLLWRRMCISPQPRRDFPVLVVIPLLSPFMFGVTWWNAPDQTSNWNIWFIVFPMLITIAMFSYSLYSMVKRRYFLLSTLGTFISGVVAFLESGVATSIILTTFNL